MTRRRHPHPINGGRPATALAGRRPSSDVIPDDTASTANAHLARARTEKARSAARPDRPGGAKKRGPLPGDQGVSRKELDRSRWNVELDIRSIKTTPGMEPLSCRPREMADKEIGIHLLACDPIRMLMPRFARSAVVPARMLGFRHALQLWLAWSRSSAIVDDPDLVQLLELIADERAAKRPGAGRTPGRQAKTESLPLLTPTRPQARERVRGHGYPAKIE